MRLGDAPAAALASLLRVPGSGLADLSLALRAHTLAGAERFNDLIGLASLRGVDSHAYQAETVRQVLRVRVPVALVHVEARRRKLARELVLALPAGSPALDAPPCDGCHGAALRPALCDGRVHVLCSLCAPDAQGRLRCPACTGAGG